MGVLTNEPLAALFTDFGVTCTWTVSAVNYSATGLLDMPAETDGALIISNEYSLTLIASEATSLARGQAIVVDGVNYTLREGPRKIDDGKLVKMELSKA